MGMSVRAFVELAEWTWGSNACSRRVFVDLRLLFWGTLALPSTLARRLDRIGAPDWRLGAPQKHFGAPRPSLGAPTWRAEVASPQKLSQLAARRAPGPQKFSQLIA